MKTGLLTDQHKFLFALLLGISFIFSSCGNTQKVTYFNNIEDGVIPSSVMNLEPVVQKSDILSITVSSLNPEASIIFNTPNLSGQGNNVVGAGNIAPSSGYLVNNDGYIQFPVLGNILAAGLSKQKLKDDITKMLIDKKLLIDPIVNVRYLNFRVTVLGEVARPTVVTVPNEKISILEAIGLAGDLTIYAKRENVLLIREEKGSKLIKRLNLNTSEIFTSPYYYLKSNDVLYIEPNSTKISATSNTRQILPIVLSGLSFVAIILTRVIN
ncbi:MAG: polysaccharide biosynthesis/export family protein [Flavitalea sp.]